MLPTVYADWLGEAHIKRLPQTTIDQFWWLSKGLQNTNTISVSGLSFDP